MAFSFGQTPASTPGFSFSSTPAFGATGGGTANLPKASSTPLFGATPSSTPGFGAASSASLFGAASSAAAAPFSFSTSQPSQQQPTLFGAGPASKPSLFGGASSAPLFGGASTPSLFGGGASALAFGLASAPAASSSAFGSFFGQPATAAAAPAGGVVAPFGGGATAAPAAPDLSAIRELESIKDSFVAAPNNPRYRFRALLLNVVDDPAARVKPPGVEELQWRTALQQAGGPDNPDRLWPVQALGFKDLLARKAAQDAAIKENAERLDALGRMAAQLASRHEAVLREQLEGVRRRHHQLSHRLLRLLRHIDALEGRFARAAGYGGGPRDLLQRLSAQLGEVEAALAPSPANGGGLQGKVAALAAAARLRTGGPGGGAATELEAALQPEALGQVFDVLQQYGEALARMTEVLQRDERHVAMLEHAARGEKLV